MATAPPIGVSGELTAVLDAIPDGVVMTDPRGQLLFVNRVMAGLLELPAPDAEAAAEVLRGTRLVDGLGAPCPPERLPGHLALDGRAPPPLEVGCRFREQGQTRWYSVSATPLRDATGQLERVLTVYRDITPQHRAVQALRYLAEASAALISSLDGDTLLDTLARLTVPAIADWCEVALLQPDGVCLPVVIAHPDPAKRQAMFALRKHKPWRFDSDTGVGQALRTGRPYLTHSLTEAQLEQLAPDPGDLRALRSLDFKSVISVPLMSQGRVLGLLSLCTTGESNRRFDGEDLALAVELASRTVLALENARLHQETREALRRKDEEVRLSETLRRLGNTFAAELDPDLLAQRILDEATALIGARWGAFLHEPRAGEPPAPPRYAAPGKPGEALEQALSAWAGAEDSLLRHEGLLHSPEPARDGARRPPLPAEAQALATWSVLAAQITSPSSGRLGTLVFGHPATAFTAGHERALQGVAAQAAIALDNARLFRKAQKAEEQVRQSEENLRLALSAGRMGFFDFDYATMRVAYTAHLQEMLGVPEGGVGFAEFGKFIHPEDVAHVFATIRQAIAAGSEDVLYRYRAQPGGQMRWLETYAKLVQNPAGQPVRMLGVTINITERHLAQEQVRRLVEELQRSNAELERFAYAASHDLQEPLRMVASYTQLLARRYKGRLDEDADTFIGFAVDGVARMQRLIAGLLSYSRVSTRPHEPAPVPCDAVLERSLANLRAALQESGAEVTADALPEVAGDELLLEQLLQNLIGNALKFRGERTPRVHVSAERRGDEWLFSVKDNGIGIDPQHFDRLFVLFKRLHTQDEYSGSGIGLALCKRIVERHGGRIWVESTPGEGSSFLFTLSAPKDL